MSAPVIVNRQRRYRVPLARLQRFARRLAHRLRTGDRTFTIVLVNDRVMRRFNRDFRKQNKPTDVLSFPAGLDGLTPLDNPSLGDMIISVETARRQAIPKHHSLEREICVLVIHGLLHLLGYDHETDRGEMHRKELKLQRELL